MMKLKRGAKLIKIDGKLNTKVVTKINIKVNPKPKQKEKPNDKVNDSQFSKPNDEKLWGLQICQLISSTVA